MVTGNREKGKLLLPTPKLYGINNPYYVNEKIIKNIDDAEKENEEESDAIILEISKAGDNVFNFSNS